MGAAFLFSFSLASVSLLPLEAAAERAHSKSADVRTETLRLDGLEGPAQIRIDRWGVPHITASTHYDAFFVQGFNAARDRLWQIDLWRRRGLGLLSEVFGASYVEQDRAARLFLYRGDMYREWLAYGNNAKRITEAFVAGINAYVELTEIEPDRLPPEFRLLDYRPARWQAEDVVRIRSHGLLRNVVQEVQRAKLICAGGLELAAVWKRLEPEWKTSVPEGLDPCKVPGGVLNDYLLATAPVTFKQPDQAVAIAQTLALATDTGSNNWVVAPSRTTTGRPILANDPHRAHGVPSLRYAAHLKAPGVHVIGAGEPALPGISIGHNDRIAFGLTIFPVDQEDLYFYAREGAGYRWRGAMEKVQVIEDHIRVRGRAAVKVEHRFTRHGPVVFADDDVLWAVRAAWLEPGMAPYFGSVEYMRANEWRTFSAALNRWGAPSENQVYADIDGNIGYKAAGLSPRRTTWDGLLPVPGDGRHEWEGFIDMDHLPTEFNPARGFAGTANSMNLPETYDINRFRLGFEWSAPWRYKRLWQELSEPGKHSLATSTRMQRDYHELLADEVLARIPDLKSFGSAGELLSGWDRVLARDSAAGALWAVWFYHHLTPAVAQALGGENAALLEPLDPWTVIDALDGKFPKLDTRTILRSSLEAAWATCEQKLGSDPSQWRWGDLHRTSFVHPLHARADQELRKQMNLPSLARGGSTNTLNNTTFGNADFLVRSGASWRMVLDVGNWDAARMTNAPGQSGDPRSPFYGNLLEGWANDSDFPLLWSDAVIDEHTVHIIHLAPVSPD